jgi:circadian clock protein KaiC
MDLAPMATGVPGLDDVLSGGLPSDRLYLIQGEPGVGKTTLALQFLFEGVKAGEPVLYITLSETREELEQVARSHGWTLDGISLYDLSQMEEFLGTAADNSVFHPAEVELGETTRAMQALIDEVGPRRAVFDSLSEMRLLAREPLRYRRQILALKQYFAGKGCTVLLLDDQSADHGDLHLQSIAHGVIRLESRPVGFGVDRRRLRVQKLRGVAFRSGYHDVCMERGGLRVFPRLIAAEHRHDVAEGVLGSGSESLDALTAGGFDRGTSNLFLGPAGSGKSTVAATFAYAASRRGERSAMYLFEESPRTLYKRMHALGMDLEAETGSGRMKIQHIDPAELTPGQFVQQVRDEVESGETTVVVIDSLNGFLNAMSDERFLVLQLHELLTFLGQQGVTSILVVSQHGMIAQAIETPLDVSYLADTLLLFRFFEHEGSVRRAIAVVKRRGGPHDRGIRELIFDAENGVQIGEGLDDLHGVLTGVPVRSKPFPQS